MAGSVAVPLLLEVVDGAGGLVAQVVTGPLGLAGELFALAGVLEVLVVGGVAEFLLGLALLLLGLVLSLVEAAHVRVPSVFGTDARGEYPRGRGSIAGRRFRPPRPVALEF